MTIVVYSPQLNSLALVNEDPTNPFANLWEVSDETAMTFELNELFFKLLRNPLVPWLSWDWIFLGEL